MSNTQLYSVPLKLCSVHFFWLQKFVVSAFFITTHFYIWKCTLNSENGAQHCHQQWAPLLSSPMHQPCLNDCNRCKKMTSFLLELGPLTPLQTRKIYPYHLSFTKYILRPCQHNKYISKVWQWHFRVQPPKNISLLHFTLKIYFCRCDTDIMIFVWHFRVHVSKIFFRFHGFLWANIYKYIYRPWPLVM